MTIDFTIDSNLMTNWPSTVDLQPAESVVSQSASGHYIPSPRTGGAEITVTWGVDTAILAVMAELRMARNGLIAHEIEFTDPSGTTHTYQVNWLSDPPVLITVEYFYKAFTIVFKERPIPA